jgi:lipoic acid synthetase
MGFLYAACGPLVRSSYRAAEVFVKSIANGDGASGLPNDQVGAALAERVERARREAARVNDELGPDPAGTSQPAPGDLVPPTQLVRRT